MTADEHDLSEEELFYLELEIWRQNSRITRKFYNRIPRVLPSTKFSPPSVYKLARKIAALSRTEERVYDACVNSCVAFTGARSLRTRCWKCKEPRWKPNVSQV